MHPDVPQTTVKDVQYAISLHQNNGFKKKKIFVEKLVLINMQKFTKYLELQVLH